MAEGKEDFEMKQPPIITYEGDDMVGTPVQTEVDDTVELASCFAEQNIGNFVTIEENAIDLPIGWQSDNSLSDSLSVLFEKELWTDVTFTFKTEENVGQVKGHKIMLAARSPVFQAMFFGVMESKNEIEIADASPESFRLFLNCLYTDDVGLDENSLSQVVTLAHKYQVSHLLDLCSEELEALISVENACQILDLAVFYNLESLIETACNFVDDHADKILETEGFMDLPVETLKVILSGDTFHTKELKLLHKCLEWAENKCKEQGLELEDRNKRQVLGDAFFFLRLPTMSLSEFTKNVSKTQLITLEESIKIYQHMGCPSPQEEVCNSITSRKPRSSMVPWPKGKNEMKFHCPDDVYLTGIHLNGVEDLLEYQAPSFRPRSDGDEQPEMHLLDISIQGKLTVKETNQTVRFEIPYCTEFPDFVSLETNIFLTGIKQPYTLIIEARCFTSYSGSYLERLRKLFAPDDCYLYNDRERTYSFKSSNNPEHKRLLNILHKSFPYSSYQRLIEGVKYVNISNR